MDSPFAHTGHPLLRVRLCAAVAWLADLRVVPLSTLLPLWLKSRSSTKTPSLALTKLTCFWKSWLPQLKVMGPPEPVEGPAPLFFAVGSAVWLVAWLAVWGRA